MSPLDGHPKKSEVMTHDNRRGSRPTTRVRVRGAVLALAAALTLGTLGGLVVPGCDEVAKVRCDPCMCPSGCGAASDTCCQGTYPYLCEANGQCYTNYAGCSSACPSN